MIDLHAHPLPGIDDGPADLDAALDLLAVAAAGGIETMAATPHLRDDFPAVRVDRVKARCVALRVSAERCGVPAPHLVAAGEVALLWALAASAADLRHASYAGRGRDLLVEVPSGRLPPRFDEGLFRLVAAGYRVVLAHPERSVTFREEPRRLSALLGRDVIAQVNAGSILDSRGHRGHQAAAVAMVREGLATIIASDAHSAGPWRPPRLAEAVNVLERTVGGWVRWLVTDAPAAVLAGEELPPRPAAGAARPRLRWRASRP